MHHPTCKLGHADPQHCTCPDEDAMREQAAADIYSDCRKSVRKFATAVDEECVVLRMDDAISARAAAELHDDWLAGKSGKAVWMDRAVRNYAEREALRVFDQDLTYLRRAGAV